VQGLGLNIGLNSRRALTSAKSYKSINKQTAFERYFLLKVPKARFFVSKNVNLYYHVCVLFSEYFPAEYADGILNNSAYRQQHEHLKTESLHQKFQNLWQYSYYAWDFVGKSLSEADTMSSTKETLVRASQDQMDIWLQILSEALPSYEPIWSGIEGKLEEYKARFEAEWNAIHETVLTKMSKIAKLPWKTEHLNVHFVDCVYGAQSWVEDVVVPPFPDIDIEKKLLSHEIAHTLVPDYFLKTKLQKFNLDCSIAHTIVDLIAYFGVKEHVTDPERRGIKPNPNYYAEVSKLYPIFEDYYKNLVQYQKFDDILKQISERSKDKEGQH
jgi:hypothetical protein